MCLLKSSDQVRFEDLQDKLCHSAYFRRDKYPSTTAGTYNLSVRHYDTIQGEIQGGHIQRQGRCCYGGGGGQGYQGWGTQMNFIFQHWREDCVPSNDGTFIDWMKCYNCNKPGLKAMNFPETKHPEWSSTQMMKIMLGFTQGTDIPCSWIFLDRCLGENCEKCIALLDTVRYCKHGEKWGCSQMVATIILQRLAVWKCFLFNFI